MKGARRLCPLAALMSLCACALGPNYTPPMPPQGAKAPFVSASPTATTATEVPNAWWQLYDDPVLNGLIDQAFKANEDLKTAEADLAASRAIYEGARTGLYPQTEIEAAAVYGRDPTVD